MKNFLITSLLFCVCAVWATQPLDPEARRKYEADGSYKKRLEFVQQIGKHKTRPDVAQRTLLRLKALASGAEKDTTKAVLPRWQGMPTKGTNKVLVLLIDFPDYPHRNEASLITSKLFGDGTPSEYPKESLRNYYRRASYSQLEIRGNALGWYRMQHNRSYYTPTSGDNNAANRTVMQEVIQHFDATHDFSQYDNNGDGKVDYVAVIWSGPDNGWGNFWWGYQWELANPISADGVQFETFSWQWESRPVGAAYEAETIIHETGHALGLPDYYDYTPSQGPAGGVGGLDMMAGNYADHNAFSKFMLEWLTPRAVPAGTSDLTLRALAQFGDAVAIMPDYTANSPYAEYFMVENRHRVNNDTGNPSDGLLIWHIDATPNARGEDFLYNNSDTSHKLLRLMEADGLEEIENGDGKADAGDYYNQGESLTSTSTPNSRAYNNTDTHVAVRNISANGSTMTAQFAVEGTQTGPRLVVAPDSIQQFALEDTTPASQSFQVTAFGATIGYAIADNAPWLSVSPGNGSSAGAPVTHTISYNIAGLVPGTYQATITITGPQANNSPVSLPVTLIVMGNQLGRALDATNFTWTSGGPQPWFEQTTVTHDGVDAVQSGNLADRQTNWLQTTITGPGTLSFWWKASTEQNWDFLLFYMDGQLRPERLTGLTEWQSASVVVPAGAHTFRWAYAKDESVSANADAVWVDQVSFVSGEQPPVLSCAPLSLTQVAAAGQNPAPLSFEVWNSGGGSLSYSIADNVQWLSVAPTQEVSGGARNQHTVTFDTAALSPGAYQADITITAAGASGSPQNIHLTLSILAADSSLAAALDFPDAWNTGGNRPWTAQAAITHDQEDAAASGTLNNLEESWIETTLQGPGTVTFWWKVSSEDDFDFLEVLVDNRLNKYISGELDWRPEEVFIPAGSHTVRWRYSKDISLSSGSDAAWLDQVAFVEGGTGPATLLSANFDAGLPAGWNVVDYGDMGLVWVFNDPAERGNLTGGSGGFAIADSDYFEDWEMATDLVTPAFNCSGYTNVTLTFQTDLLFFSGLEYVGVDLRVNGGNWTRIWEPNTDVSGLVSIPLPQANGQTNVQLSFYYEGFDDYWWQIDDVAVTASSTAPPARPLLTEWRKAWEDFAFNYSYFTHKHIDWAPVHAQYTNAFAQVFDAAAFAAQLNSVLQVLHDWHVAVKGPDNIWLGYQGVVTNNYPSTLLTNYTAGAPFTDVHNAHLLYHAWISGNLAYLVVDGLDADAFAPITDADLDAIFQQYQSAAGLILDLRSNTGGSETNAARIASRFTSVPVTYGYTRTRVTGADVNAFTPFAAKTLLPSAGRHFTNQVICLIGQQTMSAAEWFALMLRACSQVTFIGDRTRGATGNPAEFSIPSLGVSYTISRWIGYDADQHPFEDTGLAPDIALPPGPGSYNDAARRDYVLERAIALLKTPRLTIAHPAANRLTLTWPGDAASRYTLLRATNLATPAWSLAPGWTSNRLGTPGQMSYTNSTPTLPHEFYRLQLTP